MPEMPTVRLRLPVGLFEFAREVAEDEGQPLSTFLQQILCNNLRNLIALHANAKAAGVLDQMLNLEREMVSSSRAGSVGVSVAPPQEDKNGHKADERFETDMSPDELIGLLDPPPSRRKKKAKPAPVAPEERQALVHDLIDRMSQPRRGEKGVSHD